MDDNTRSSITDLYVQESFGGRAHLAAAHPDDGPGPDGDVVAVRDHCAACGEFFMVGQEVDPAGPVHVTCEDYADDYAEQRRLLGEG